MLTRGIRNAELTASDWTQLPDATCDKAAWAEWRQKLRDLTDDPAWPDVDLPERPNA